MDKWYAIAMIAFVLSMFGGLAYENYSKKECKIELAKVGKSTEDIEKICR